MSADQTPAARGQPEPLPAWRYRTGLALFTLGNVMFFGSPFAVPAVGLSPSYIAVLVVIAEVITFSSVFFLGWQGLKALKSKMFGFLKHDPGARPVGRVRHRLGLFLVFVLSLTLDLLGIALVFVAYAKTTESDPFPIVLGLDHEQLAWLVAALFIGSYVALTTGIFVLGDHWWGRFRELFIWQGDEDQGFIS